jgi:hypothetical protein
MFRRTSFAYRLARALLPSPISALLCICMGISLVGVYLVVLSVTLGTSLPSLFDGEWGVAYTNNIVRPLLSLFSNITLNKVLFLGMWGLGGLAVYFLLEYAVLLVRNARRAEHDIQYTATGIIRHPAIASFFAAALWRACVLAVFIPLLTITLHSPVAELGGLAPKAVLGHLGAARTISQLLLLAVQFALFGHVIVTFLRLFAMRMRLFSDDPM